MCQRAVSVSVLLRSSPIGEVGRTSDPTSGVVNQERMDQRGIVVSDQASHVPWPRTKGMEIKVGIERKGEIRRGSK